MIASLSIKNFRSIRDLTINLGPLNFFIGPNSAGKSNIMRALNLCLGDTYSTIRSFNDTDFYNYNKSNQILIRVIFDTPLICNTAVYGFQLTFNGINNECAYVALNSQGNILTYPSNGREVRVTSDMKDEVALMYLGLDRQASQQIRPTQWTLYGKLLRYIEKNIIDINKHSFTNDINTSYNSNIFPEVQQMENILSRHVKEQTGLDLCLKLSMLSPMETLKNLRPYIKEPAIEIEFDAEDVGAGAQSALAIAIAQAYNEIVKQSLVMAIEEPELYMHPHGCRHFSKVLKQMSSNGVQVICTTHERCFVDISNFQSIYLIRKQGGETIVKAGINQGIASSTSLEMSAKFDDEINEVFFASHVILVEGPADKIACRLASEKLGLALDKECISIIECGSNTAIKPIAEVLRLFDISAYALVDEDPGNANTATIIRQLNTILGINNVFLQSPKLEGLFGLYSKPSKVDALRIFPVWFNSNPPPNVYINLKHQIEQSR